MCQCRSSVVLLRLASGHPRDARPSSPRSRPAFLGGPSGGNQKGKGRAREAGLPRGAGLERGRAADAKRRRSAVERPLTREAAETACSTPAPRGLGNASQ
jgi:hypothetical protein